MMAASGRNEKHYIDALAQAFMESRYRDALAAARDGLELARRGGSQHSVGFFERCLRLAERRRREGERLAPDPPARQECGFCRAAPAGVSRSDWTAPVICAACLTRFQGLLDRPADASAHGQAPSHCGFCGRARAEASPIFDGLAGLIGICHLCVRLRVGMRRL